MRGDDCFTEFEWPTGRLDDFSCSTFGVGVQIADFEGGGGACRCSLTAGSDTEPAPCQDFHRALRTETSDPPRSCPAGLKVISKPVLCDEKVQACLMSWGFLDKDSPELGHSQVAAALGLDQRTFQRRFREVPRLSREEGKGLENFMGVSVDLLSFCHRVSAPAALEASREGRWREERGDRSLVGCSSGFQSVREALPTYANSREPLLIGSEPGNGRYLMASTLHRLGPWRDRPFITEDLSLLPEPLHETELFGSQRAERPGLIGSAAGGTLFLMGIERLTLSAQRKIFHLVNGSPTDGRTLPGRSVRPFRLIAATDLNLDAEVRRGCFRPDLYHRLSTLNIFIPPLRERAEDIPLLVQYFLRRHIAGKVESPPQVEGEAMEALMKYSWPGNVRELEEELKRVSAMGQPVLKLEDFSGRIRHTVRPPRPPLTDIRLAVGKLETELICRTLSDTNWNKSQAARILGLSRLGLQKKIDRYDLDRRR